MNLCGFLLGVASLVSWSFLSYYVEAKDPDLLWANNITKTFDFSPKLHALAKRNLKVITKKITVFLKKKFSLAIAF